MIRYKVYYGGWTGERMIADNLTKKQADELYSEYSGGDMYMQPRIEKYEKFDIREDRKLKLEKIKEKYEIKNCK